MSQNLAADETLDKSQGPLNSNASAGKREAGTTWAEMRKAWQAYALLAPTFLMLIVFMYYPPILGLIRSFYEWAPGTDATYVGLSNFRAYFAYPETAREITNMGKLILFGLFSNMVVPFVMAEMIYSVRSMVAKGFYRLLIIIPMLTPGLVTILLWKHIYDPKFGPVHTLLSAVGLECAGPQLAWGTVHGSICDYGRRVPLGIQHWHADLLGRPGPDFSINLRLVPPGRLYGAAAGFTH